MTSTVSRHTIAMFRINNENYTIELKNEEEQ